MKLELAGLARHYLAALRGHLEPSRTASLQPAHRLGHRAVTLGLETLDLAKLHEQALMKLVLARYTPPVLESMIRRAGEFFAEAVGPIEETHRLVYETKAEVDRLNQRLRGRNEELAASNRQLKEEVRRRKSVEESLKSSELHYSRLLDQSRHMQEELRLLSRQLLFAQEEERKKISRELHDVIAQTLTGINVRLATLKMKAAHNTKGLDRSIAHTQRLVEQSVAIVHRFARELRPAVLDDLGLVAALHTFMKQFTTETGIRVSLSAFAEVEQLSGDQRTALYRVAQEALTNVARHAEASLAEVQIQKLDGSICMKISDNGKGFHQEQLHHPGKRTRLGLLGMGERLEMVGGTFTLTSAPGKGTTVLARLPFKNGIPTRGGGRKSLTARPHQAQTLVNQTHEPH